MKKLVSFALAAILCVGALTACEKAEIPAESGESGETETDTAETDDKTAIIVGEGADYATLGEALSYVKAEREAGNADPLTIWIKAGTYCVEETLTIDGVMSDLTIEPFGDGEVRVFGAYRLTGFEPDTFNGVDCLSATLRDDDEFTDFFVNGQRSSMTRYPAEGYLFPVEWENDDGGLFSGSKWFVAPDDGMDDFTNIEKIRLTGFHYWVDEHAPLESYDPETNKVTLFCPTRCTIADDAGSCVALMYYLENVRETFGAHKDEWYAEDGKLYYIPRDESITPETIEAYVPTVTKLFDIHGTEEKPVTGLTIRGIEMGTTKSDYQTLYFGEYFGSDNQGCSWMDAFIMLEYTDGCVFEDCRLINYGWHGIALSYGSKNARISRCEFYGGGGCGVKITGDMNEEGPRATDHNTVEDCTITHCGQVHHASVGIMIQDSGSNVIQHNEVAYMTYSGISVGWKWGYEPNPSHDNLVTWNHVHHIGDEKLSDLAGIYTLGVQNGTVISNNLIHDVRYADYGYGARGFGMDQGSSFITFENNIVYNVQTSCLGCGIGEGSVIRNNIFVSTGEAVVDDGTDEKHNTLNFDTNIFCIAGTRPIHDTKRNGLSKKCVKSTNNLIFNLTGDEIIATNLSEGKQFNLEDTQKFFNLEVGSVIADPKFADVENHDFTLAEDSPAIAMGFVPFDLSDVGPRK